MNVSMQPAPDDNKNNSAITLSLIADHHKRYPGEEVTFCVQVQAIQPVLSYTLVVFLPQGVEVRCALANGTQIEVPQVVNADQGATLRWTQKTKLAPGERHEYLLTVCIGEFSLLWQFQQKPDAQQDIRWATPVREPANLFLHCTACLQGVIIDPTANPPATSVVKLPPAEFISETLPIMVNAKSQYLQYLPALYEQDDFMGRFLMLFESFWNPIEHQIENIYDYFDPKLTPRPFLHWLATWFDLTLDKRWAEDKQRKLVSQIVKLYRQSGTRTGLQAYLELLTDGKVEITEYKANYFRIGKTAQLGWNMAFGAQGQPHTFAVKVTLPANQRATVNPDGPNRPSTQQVEQILRTMIDAEKPVHTTYTLTVAYSSEENR